MRSAPAQGSANAPRKHQMVNVLYPTDVNDLTAPFCTTMASVVHTSDISLVVQALCLPEVIQGVHVVGMWESHTWDPGLSNIKESGGEQQPTGEEAKENHRSRQQAKEEQSQETQ